MILLDFLLVAALLVWGCRQIRDGARAAGMSWLQRALRRVMASARSGPLALAVGFSADLGAGLAMLALVAAPTWCVHVLTISGAVVMLGSRPSPPHDAARGLLGAGVVILSLRLLASGGNAVFATPFFLLVAGALSQDPLLAVTAGATAAVCLRTQLAAVLLLAGTWASWLHPEAAVAALAGVHAAGAVLAFWKRGGNGSNQQARAARAVVTWLMAACAVLLREELSALLAGPPVVAILQLHLFSLALAAAVSLACSDGLLRLTGPFRPTHDMAGPSPVTGLRLRDLENPSVALAAALREVMRMADLVESMLRSMKSVFLRGDPVAARAIRDAELRVNGIYLSLKTFLAEMARRPLSAGELDRWEELLAFLSASEQVADRVVRVLDELERKLPGGGRAYPAEAQKEVLGLLGQLKVNMRLGASVCLDRRIEAAQELAGSMEVFRTLEQACRSAHVRRLVAGDAGSSAISALHFNLMADMLDMNDQIGGFARRVVAIHSAAPPGPRDGTFMPVPALEQRVP